ncbi:adipokinetic hormone/corazonin-related peptide receptor variant I-like [Neodiprion fabricii]|uniref:adipokinetic hormone/corazonin-related peptide receptor variant I-like n=1 Tax=Neodiprion fabricii TaxID=2872261 RepID=UPI001ED90644|nr:adipokinetic hormone/corazonin-related peptide receptor variant I-like [Neodiprion fabricii]
MMGHLAAADLLVTFFMIPLEGGFHLIVQWLDGNLACKFFLFLRAFALYLSSNVLVCVSLDRYSAILHPLKNYDARRRGKMMLCGAWICSFFYALPQAGAIIYNSACLSATFVIPLVVIVFAQITIFYEIDGQICANEQDTGGPEMGDGKKITLRRSNTCSIEQAKRKTLRMTATTVLIFTICWGPYVVTIFWSIFNEEIFAWMQDWHWNVLFFAAALPPCLNPSLNARREIN